MNTKLKQTGLFGVITILTLAMMALVPGFVGEADAKLVLDKHVVLPEAEIDVDLSLAQVTEPVKSREVSVKTTKGFVPTSVDSDATTYHVVYRVQNDGVTDVKNVMISVSSDVESVDEKLSGWLDVRHSVITVLVKAMDPSSIDVKIIGFQT